MNYRAFFDKLNNFKNLKKLSFHLNREAFKNVFFAAANLDFVEHLEIYYDGKNYLKTKLMPWPSVDTFDIFPRFMNRIQKVDILIKCHHDDPYSFQRLNEALKTLIHTDYKIEIHEVSS